MCSYTVQSYAVFLATQKGFVLKNDKYRYSIN